MLSGFNKGLVSEAKSVHFPMIGIFKHVNEQSSDCKSGPIGNNKNTGIEIYQS